MFNRKALICRATQLSVVQKKQDMPRAKGTTTWHTYAAVETDILEVRNKKTEIMLLLVVP